MMPSGEFYLFYGVFANSDSSGLPRCLCFLNINFLVNAINSLLNGTNLLRTLPKKFSKQLMR